MFSVDDCSLFEFPYPAPCSLLQNKSVDLVELASSEANSFRKFLGIVALINGLADSVEGVEGVETF